MGYSLAVGENAHSPRPRAARAITPTPHIFLPDPLETPVAAENACTGHTSPQLNILFWRRQEQDELQQPLYALSSSQKAKDSFLFAISLLQLAETVAGPKRRALIRRDLSSLIGCRVEALGTQGGSTDVGGTRHFVISECSRLHHARILSPCLVAL